jgi:hypothetical protein
MSLHRPLSITPAEVEQFGRVYIYDTRNRNTVWEGRLQDPGRSVGSDGEVYQLAAIGGSAHLQDDTRQLYYIDTDPGRWDSIDVTTAAATVQAIADTGATVGSETPALTLRIPQMTSVDGAIPSRVVVAHRGFAAAGMKIGGIQFDWDSGLTAATLVVVACTPPPHGVGAADIACTATFNDARAAPAYNRVVDPGAGSSAVDQRPQQALSCGSTTPAPPATCPPTRGGCRSPT